MGALVFCVLYFNMARIAELINYVTISHFALKYSTIW